MHRFNAKTGIFKTKNTSFHVKSGSYNVKNTIFKTKIACFKTKTGFYQAKYLVYGVKVRACAVTFMHFYIKILTSKK